MFSKVLIANRGEIAVRISRTLQQMGITAAAVFSDPDRDAPHAICADEAYRLEGCTAADTYLRGDRIIELACEHGVDAIHPGYGFLSENDQFAKRCADAGITFIGPTPAVIRTLGDKVQAKHIVQKAGVPVVPGCSETDLTPAMLRSRAQEIGYPVLIKAAAGGGGKGMRVVESEDGLIPAAEAAGREAQAAFGDDRIFLERFLQKPRHVEVQILGDHHGNVRHLFERECSIQRRHQKIIEETPSPALSPQQREAITAAALRVAKAVGYTSAGTVEFLVDKNDDFYFLEVNTRLQVEHPVTEETTGVDLVRAQIEIAAGQPLTMQQEQIQQRGHAIECRIYAEDPAAGFLPSTGIIDHFAPPQGPGVRIDSGVTSGSEVTVHYDPMLAKIICTASNRAGAIDKMLWCLDRFVVMGVTSNVSFLRALVDHQEFRNANVHTHFLDETEITPPHVDAESALVAAAIACKLGFTDAQAGSEHTGTQPSPWQDTDGWRIAT